MTRKETTKQPPKKTEAEQPHAQTASEPQTAATAAPDSAVSDLTSQLQRLQAEFDNYRKRVDTDAARISERHVESILRELLPVIDGIELCITHYGTKEAHDAKGNELLTGITLLHKQLEHILEHWKVTRIPANGLTDPKLHEVYLTETTTAHTPGSILAVLQHGYTRNGTVLRTAKIKAARKE